MPQQSVNSAAVTLLLAVCCATSAFSQCENRITLVPLREMKAAGRARDFVRFRYALSDSDSLLVQSHEDTKTIVGPYDTGFEFTRHGKVLRRFLLTEMPEMKRGKYDFSDSFFTLAIVRACGRGGPVFFLTMQYSGDETSPVLIFVLVPSASDYTISYLPFISGGEAVISKGNPFHLTTWDNLQEGECNACATAYEITEYEIRNGKPIQTRQRRTRRQYSSGDFDDRRRIRFAR